MNISMLINGADVVARDGRTFERRDPVTGAVATVAPAAGVADAQAVAKAAGEAFPAWSKKLAPLNVAPCCGKRRTRLRP